MLQANQFDQGAFEAMKAGKIALEGVQEKLDIDQI